MCPQHFIGHALQNQPKLCVSCMGLPWAWCAATPRHATTYPGDTVVPMGLDGSRIHGTRMACEISGTGRCRSSDSDSAPAELAQYCTATHSFPELSVLTRCAARRSPWAQGLGKGIGQGWVSLYASMPVPAEGTFQLVNGAVF
jgi:hypothetical protein